MANAKRKFIPSRRLSKAEIAALTKAVLERARQALHNSQESAALAFPPRKPRIPARDSDRPAQRKPMALTFSRPRFGSMVASGIGRQFECVIIACCMIVTGTAWMVHLSV